MAIDTTFAAAYIDNGVKHRILGRILKPFSLWHLFLLQVIDSPLITAEEINLFHLKTAVGICCLSYRQSKVKRPRFPLFLFGKELQAEVDRFMLYVGDYLNRPEFTIQPHDLDAPRYVGLPVTPAPAVIVTAYRAVQSSRLTINEVWNMPIGEAYIAEAMWFQNQGEKLNFLDDEEKKFQAEMKAAEMNGKMREGMS